MNRGNYRADVFIDEGARCAFENCLFEACEKSSWVLHAFVLMRNHYHLALETPEGNLISGMQWLQSTFSNRFNRFRSEHGHLFQGRYKSILTEDGKSLGEVCDYIHLNPVKAGILTVEQLLQYRHSSYWYLHHPQRRPKFLRPQTALECAGGISDNHEGRLLYANRLELEVATAIRSGGWQKRQRALCRGWAIGGAAFKAGLIKEFNLTGTVRSWDSVGVREVRILLWQNMLEDGLRVLNRNPNDADRQRKSVQWKLAIAAWMKSKTQASNRWLSSKLNMGTPTAMSHNLTDYRRSVQATDPAWKKLIALNEA